MEQGRTPQLFSTTSNAKFPQASPSVNLRTPLKLWRQKFYPQAHLKSSSRASLPKQRVSHHHAISSTKKPSMPTSSSFDSLTRAHVGHSFSKVDSVQDSFDCSL